MKILKLKLLLLTFAIISCLSLSAQAPIPVKIVNNSVISNDSIYVAIVGQDMTSAKNFVWINVQNGQQNFMSLSDNTIQGPIYEGNGGPGGQGMYANCFAPLSTIPDQTIALGLIQGCRIFIAQKSQLFFWFFDQLTTMGYTAPNLENPTDPNTGLIYEFIELTHDTVGFHGNTSRVDAYHRPIRLELFGDGGTYHKIRGTEADHVDIIRKFQDLINIQPKFANCLILTDSIILQPSKIADFQPGGPYANYFESYVDSIWNKYRTEDLIFNGGAIGTWSGKVGSHDTLTFIGTSTGNLNQVGQIVRIPTTQEIIEASGVLAQAVHNGANDLNMQKFVCAALNRHVIDVITPNPGLQDWGDTSTYYKKSPANHYAGFWHQQGVSIDRLAYGFSYDDVYHQSSYLTTSKPDSVKIYYGSISHGSSSVSEVMPMQSIKVYPNITTTRCTVSGLNNSYLLNIIDLNGQLLQSIKLSPNLDKIDLDLSEFSNGLYFIQVHSKNGIGLAKVIRR